MDHMMPKMDGVEATKKIREMGYAYPIVALTANAVVGQAEIFIENGFDDFISKPIDIRQLNVILKKLIYDKQPPEVIERARYEQTQQTIKPELTKFFVRDAKKSVSALEAVSQNDFRKEDMQTFIIHVHAMKSALANIGETELAAAALRMEQAGREEDIGIIKTETPAFLDKLRAIIEKYSADDNKSESGEDTAESLTFLRERLRVIKEACAVYDKKTAKKVLNELKEQTWSSNTTDLLNKIAEHLLHSDFDSTVEICLSLIN